MAIKVALGAITTLCVFMIPEFAAAEENKIGVRFSEIEEMNRSSPVHPGLHQNI